MRYSESLSQNPSPKKKQRGGWMQDSDIVDLTQSSSEEKMLEEHLDLDDSTSNAEEIPVFRITDFCIYKDSQLVESTELLLLGDIRSTRFTASGIVRAQYIEDSSGDDSEDEEDGDSHPVHVEDLHIIDFNIHDVSANGELDQNMYIKTPHAYYILDKPLPIYRPFFIPLWIRHQFTHLIVSSVIVNPKISYDEFVESLSDPLTEFQLKSAEIVEYFLPFLVTIGADLKLSRKGNINNSPLVKALRSRRFSKHLEIPKKLTEPETPQFVTPVVGRVVMQHMNGPICVVGSDLTDQVLVGQLNKILHDHDDLTVMRWGKGLGHSGYYESLTMDGVKYQIGDIVSVKPGEDADEQRAKSTASASKFCVNAYARRVWFIQIAYFFDDETGEDSQGQPIKKLHGVWFVHGSQILFQESAHSHQLFLLEECDNIKVSSIFRKCEVRKLPCGEVQPPDDRDENGTSYFYQLAWDKDNCEFKDTPSSEEQRRLKSLLPPYKPCTNCGKKKEVLRPVNFHVHDFVYVMPNTTSAHPLFIAQIKELKGKGKETIYRVRYFKRYTDEWMDFRDHRRVYRSRSVNEVKHTDILRICNVKFIEADDFDAIDDWIQEDSELDRFYTNEKQLASGDLVAMDEKMVKFCSPCASDYEVKMAGTARYHLRHNDPIIVADIFAGAGGFAEGLRRTGFFETKWAIEQSASAAKTFGANHPNANVLPVDVNAVLRYMADREAGEEPAPLRAPDGSIISDEMIPRRGDVGMLVGGPPCQSFSGANYYKKADDPRSTLPFTMLSFAELLEPKYILIENVSGLLHHSVNGVKMGAIKLMCAVLITLGYQMRLGVVQAGQYGAPQYRERVIFLAVKGGCTMPELPMPTHAFVTVNSARWFKIPGEGYIRPPTSQGGKTDLFTAHPAVTVNDAISDLRAFDWTCDHPRIARTPKDVEEQLKRIDAGIVQCSVSKAPVGFPDPVAYATAPQTPYQRTMRGGNRDLHGLVTHHVTQPFSALVMELTTLVPLRPWSTHQFLPQELLPPRMKKPGNKTYFYGRLDGDAYFKTAMTAPRPNKDQSYFIHPSQKRTLSFREFARSQGFPDAYIFCSTQTNPNLRLKDFFKQVGNAVPVPLATALGRSIAAAAVSDWQREQRERRTRGGSVEC
ncbi:S-adenosyl-L-methionine-dependent methyltransferase [Mycena vulgaris]|nr:S-adenosyl-L-methionine-dependent methyltransferase [Mycena vulgaris]